MCSGEVVKTFANVAARSAADVLTAGALEYGGISKRIGAKAADTVAPLVPEKPASPPTPQTIADPGPIQKTDTQIKTDQTASQRARRAAALRAGIMSTIGPNLGNIGNTTPNLPMAYATGMKTALGQ